MSDRSPVELMLAHQQRIDEMNGDREPEPASALEYCQDVYRGRRVADPWRMRAAALALPFESPKLAVSTNLTSQDFAALLDKAIARSQGGEAKLIEHRPDQPPPVWKGRCAEVAMNDEPGRRPTRR
jgi:hypothetical protein